METPKRIMPPSEGVTLTIRITDGDEAPVQHSVFRRYDDGHGLVEVTRRTPHPQFGQFAQTFTYHGAPIADVVPTYRGSYYTNETTEMIGCARTLAEIGLQNADLSPRQPDEPDMLVVHPQLGSFYMEFTLGADPEERAFQEGMKLISAAVQEKLASRSEPWLGERAVSFGFVSVPRQPRTFPAFADELVELVLATDGRGGTHEVVDPRIAAMMPSFQILIGGKVGVSAGGLVMERGMPDYAAIAEMRIAQKRAKTYTTNGLPLWVAVGMSLPLIKPDFMGALYEADVEIGHLDRAIVADPAEYVEFRRLGESI